MRATQFWRTVVQFCPYVETREHLKRLSRYIGDLSWDKKLEFLPTPDGFNAYTSDFTYYSLCVRYAHACWAGDDSLCPPHEVELISSPMMNYICETVHILNRI